MLVLSAANSRQPWRTPIPNCKTQMDVNQLHARLITTGLIDTPSFTTKLILKFSSSPHQPLVQFARHLFFTRHPKYQHDPFLYNAIIKSFSHGNDPESAIVIVCLMLDNTVKLDRYTFSLALKACSVAGLLESGEQIHGLLIKCGYGCDLFIQNCLICLYMKCGCVEFGRKVFDGMLVKDSVSYNAVIDGYVKNGNVGFAREVFDCVPVELRNLITWNSMISGYVEGGFEFAWKLFVEMPVRDLVSWNLMVECCLKSRKVGLAHALFNRMPERDVVSWANMIDGYAKIGEVDVARAFFDEMPKRDVVSCNAMMTGYVKNGQCLEALKVLHDMLSGSTLNLIPDYATLLIALSAIAQLGCIDEGVALHYYIEENGFVLDGRLGVALIDMYAKCGSIERAMSVFEDIEEKSVDHWNAMIGGLAIHGSGELAFDLFMEMERLHLQPDEVTFIAVLNACAHAGLVKEGLVSFEIMRRVHKMEPQLQHYGCVVDILSRAGFVEQATTFIEEMPIEPNDVVWRTLLSSCMNHENFSVGDPVAKHLVRQDSCSSNAFVLLSNMYARSGNWDYVRRVRTMMKEKDMKKIPGCSWIELDGTVHEFFVSDTCHHQVREIYSTLDRRLAFISEVACEGL